VSERIRRVFVPSTPRPSDRVTLDPDEAHHVTRVLRLKQGDPVALFDGRGGEWDATIDESTKDRVSVAVGAARHGDVEPKIAVVLHQAIVRPEKLEWVLQKGTEVGVASFRLIATERAEAAAPSPARVARYGRILMEACKQSGRRVLPSLEPGALKKPGDGVRAIVLTQGQESVPLASVLAGPRAPEVWLAVGPEGGFTPHEVSEMADLGWIRASLGPRVLRTETAGCVAAALVLHVWGDLGR